MRKHLVSIALSNRVLQRIDQEASKQKRSESEWGRTALRGLVLQPPERQTEIAMKAG